MADRIGSHDKLACFWRLKDFFITLGQFPAGLQGRNMYVKVPCQEREVYNLFITNAKSGNSDDNG